AGAPPRGGARGGLAMTDSGVPVVELEGVRLHALREAECVERVMALLSLRRGGWIASPNLDQLRLLARDPDLRRLYARADLVVADGMPLVWACRLQRTPLPSRVAGSDLIWSLSAAAAARGFSAYLLGGDPGTAEEAAARLVAASPALRVAGTACPQPGFERRDEAVAELCRRLVEAAPDLVYVALGAPKQELLIDRIRGALPAAWWIGVGASFTFVAGRVPRAPVWVRRLGLEWGHRLAHEPRRLARRYLVDDLPFGAGLLVRSAWRGLRGTT
ncbi:MAG TPA: WecB/TagA/CpsF family glycosyltransferase, partial [Planctomycetota bacterium]|nr:WecB/TagA/CpsF family glycosyltransferase [Planctomycetota bacterium]